MTVPLFCQCLERALRRHRIADTEHDGEALRPFVVLWQNVATHQIGVTDFEPRVKELPPPFGGHLLR